MAPAAPVTPAPTKPPETEFTLVLTKQILLRDPAVKISQLVAEGTAKMGENITVSRFARFKIGEQ